MVDRARSPEPTYRFRGDDSYRTGDPIGFRLDSQESNNADIQAPWKHIRKKSNQTSRFSSFSLTRSVRNPDGSIGGPIKFTKSNKIIKVPWQALQKLEAEGKIKIYEPEDIADLMHNNHKRKVKMQANNVKAAMQKNQEILVEGQIPADLIMFTD
jgi:hypothetical protein